ncbi:TRPM8 channel-associated factor homolog [Notolabrus celidotus]|uniref:TRPM8 channel-associated factor homolog n=1 Tax=Notolabrus celidotus TaxID=1203425 RepID=UPI0014902AB8|nr:TRPM8 channel-associated factor homolog [Notolabrus celidotus]XP_034557856.1 TRPM8 channel-associated factor homolog [Notolabrus celidotus]
MFNPPAPDHHEEAYVSLMGGLREVDLSGASVPCDLVLIGDHAFPLAMNQQGQVLVAASLYGKGRIVVFGHEGYLTQCSELVEKALVWLRGDGSCNQSVGVHKSVKGVADNLSKSSFQATVVGAFDKSQEAGVYVTSAYTVAEEAKDVVAFMKAGGGVLMGGQSWHWSSCNPKVNTLLQFPGNKVSGVAGIYFSEHHGVAECIPVHPRIPSSWMSVVIGKDFQDDLEFLLDGVSEFDLQGGSLASEILIHGPLAFPIGTTSDGRAFLAGAYYGQGRVIVVSHEGFMGVEKLAKFWSNAARWLDEGRQGVVGVMPNTKHSLTNLSKSGLKCEVSNFKKDLSVFVCRSNSDDHAGDIQDYVAEGGGLVVAGHAWYWSQVNRGKNPLTDFPGNHVLNKMGLTLLASTIKGDLFKAPDPSKAKDNYHFRQMLRRFAGHVTKGEKLSKQDEGNLKKLSDDCSTFLHMNSRDCCSYTQVVSTLTDVLKTTGLPNACEKCPVKSAKDHLLLSVGADVYKACPNPDALLPHLIKDNPALPVIYNHKVMVNVDTAGGDEWVSTGLYLSPGMKTFVSLPDQIVNKGWKIQIGCQTDKLKGDVLKRAPCVHERFPVTAGMMQVWNLWGGLIYLVAPPKTKEMGLEVTVQIAVPAPYYKSGVTSAADWSLLRTAPAPWAELEFANIILTVPSEVVRKLDRPDELAVFWDDIMKGIADLAVIPHKFPRKERFVAEVQISHGWMHAGYPVMMHKATAAALVSVEYAKTKGIWGPIHELGHNQQKRSWEFPSHTTECTCNLWSVYVHENVIGMKKEKAHNAMTPENRNKRAEDYVKAGRKLSSWSVWTALETYMQLQDKFGWDAFKKVFGAYHTMTDVPKDNPKKMNLYAETFSQAVNMNLTGFFKAWGWPIEPETEKKLEKLPSWSDHPMVKYN